MLDHSFGHRGKVIKKTCGEIRTFLDEIANGTSNYKSLHNLTEQVEHQYHGRFLIELIQNAHDALFEIDRNSATQDNGRIDIVISVEQPCGALYVANDGSPFTESNFDNLSRFGQSDKDPEKHIGNKGIGFRSVLEITSEPEIYSRKEIGSVAFDGFNFRFSPSVTRQIEKPIIDLLCGNDNPLMVFGGEVIPLIDWRESKIGEFRAQSQRCGGQEGTIGELKFLSPYLLPEPIYNEDFNTVIGLFERKGFATVIRLPFRNKNARDLAVKKINELDENTILFLKKAKSLGSILRNPNAILPGKQKLCQSLAMPSRLI